MKFQFTKLASAVALLSAVVVLAPRAQASQVYPDKLSTVMPCTPQCTLCHLTNAGGQGMLNAFGTVIKDTGGLRNLSNASLLTLEPVVALDRLSSTDSDGDGTFDSVQVREGKSPNGGADLCGGPTYGCGGRIAKGAPSADSRWGALGSLGAALALAFLRRSRRRFR